MSAVRTLVILLMLLVSGPVFAADFYCPAVVTLPASLKIDGETYAGARLAKVQTYLTNLRVIKDGYQQARSRGHRNQIANCLMDHLVSLDDGRALLRPVSEADEATLELLRDEVVEVMNIFGRDLRNKPELRYILRWADASVVTVASR